MDFILIDVAVKKLINLNVALLTMKFLKRFDINQSESKRNFLGTHNGFYISQSESNFTYSEVLISFGSNQSVPSLTCNGISFLFKTNPLKSSFS